jgi:hypothetical protein
MSTKWRFVGFHEKVGKIAITSWQRWARQKIKMTPLFFVRYRQRLVRQFLCYHDSMIMTTLSCYHIFPLRSRSRSRTKMDWLRNTVQNEIITYCLKWSRTNSEALFWNKLNKKGNSWFFVNSKFRLSVVTSLPNLYSKVVWPRADMGSTYWKTTYKIFTGILIRIIYLADLGTSTFIKLMRFWNLIFN